MLFVSSSEIIEDSEPERQALREKEKEEKRKKRSVLGAIAAAVDINVAADGIMGSDNVHTDEECDNEVKIDTNPISSRFSSFAFDSGATSKPTKPCASNLSRTPSLVADDRSHSQNTAPVTKRERKGQEQSGLSESDLTHITKCVSCDVKWTTRKTAKQKHMHIRTCAKKYSISDKILELLVRKELEKLTSENDSRSKSQSNNTEPAPRTLLEEVVGEPTKKRKRQQNFLTVKDVPESHDLIYNRAKMFLAAPGVTIPIPQSNSPTPAPDIDAGHPSTDSLHKEPKEGNVGFDLPPATQSFAPSRLSSLTRAPTHPNDDLETNLPPSTQPFGMSRLAIARSKSRHEGFG